MLINEHVIFFLDRKSKLKLHLVYLNNFLLLMRILKHNQYVKIKQFFKVVIKQNG